MAMLESNRWTNLPVREIVVIGVLGVTSTTCSTCTVAFNKYLIHPDRFPYAVPLVMGHMAVSTVFSGLLYLMYPSLYPALQDPAKRKQMTFKFLMSRFGPISLCFVIQLIFSNSAYFYSSIGFLQMMKESNLVFVYFLSLAFGLEKFKCKFMVAIMVVAGATLTTIRGEVDFSFMGFAMQLTSQVVESCKLVAQAVLLKAAGMALDPLTFVLFVAPSSAALLALVLCGLSVFQVSLFQLPNMAEVVDWLPILLANACLAFSLNVISALFLKKSSPMIVTFAGLLKDSCVVLTAGVVLNETITAVQIVAFVIQLLTICVWVLMKAMPEKEVAEVKNEGKASDDEEVNMQPTRAISYAASAADAMRLKKKGNTCP